MRVYEGSSKRRRGRVRERVRRFAAAGVSAVVAAAMVFSSVAAYATDWSESALTKDGITIDKTAVGLDEDNRALVQLSVEGEKTINYSDVVFVIDRSTSIDILDEAKEMITELASVTGEDNLVRVGVIKFEADPYTLLDLTELTQDNLGEILTAIEQANAGQSGGTNIQAGIEAGITMLEEDVTVEDSAKHLVLVTDGVTYLWESEDAEGNAYVETVYAKLGNIISANVDYVNDYWEPRKTAFGTNYSDFSNAAEWLRRVSETSTEGDGYYTSTIAEIIDTYGTRYVGDVYSTEDLENGLTIPDDCPYASFECALYEVGTSWQKAESFGYNTYAYAYARYEEKYPWAHQFIASLSTLDSDDDDSRAYSTAVRDGADEITGMFDELQSDILYSLGAGSVIYDEMGYGDGYNFDFVSEGMTVTVGDEVYKAVDLGDGSSYGFYEYADGKYAYVLEYDEDTDSFDFTFNVPVTDKVVISYYVELVQAPTEPDDYVLHTNKKATLTPAGGTSVDFPDPVVTYTVEETEETPGDGGGDGTTGTGGGDAAADTDAGSDGVAAEASSGSLPQTGDPLSAAAVAAAAAAGAGAIGLGALLSRRRG